MNLLARLIGLADQDHWDELAELRDRAVVDAQEIARLTGELAEALTRIPAGIPTRLDPGRYPAVAAALDKRHEVAAQAPWLRAHLDQVDASWVTQGHRHGLDLTDEATTAVVLAVLDLLADAWASSKTGCVHTGLLIHSAAVQVLACTEGGRD